MASCLEVDCQGRESARCLADPLGFPAVVVQQQVSRRRMLRVLLNRHVSLLAVHERVSAVINQNWHQQMLLQA